MDYREFFIIGSPNGSYINYCDHSIKQSNEIIIFVITYTLSVITNKSGFIYPSAKTNHKTLQYRVLKYKMKSK